METLGQISAEIDTLSALETLDLNGTQVANVEPLKGLTALRALNLNSTQVANLEPLKGLTALRTLDLVSHKSRGPDGISGCITLPNKWGWRRAEELNLYRGSINLPLVK